MPPPSELYGKYHTHLRAPRLQQTLCLAQWGFQEPGTQVGHKHKRFLSPGNLHLQIKIKWCLSRESKYRETLELGEAMDSHLPTQAWQPLNMCLQQNVWLRGKGQRPHPVRKFQGDEGRSHSTALNGNLGLSPNSSTGKLRPRRRGICTSLHSKLPAGSEFKLL